MNFILCNEKCRHQKDGYCSLEGAAQVTNALASPCRYCEAAPSSLLSSVLPQDSAGDEHDQRS
jgi:hypothetical protein